MNKYEEKNCFWLRYLVILKIDTKRSNKKRNRERAYEEHTWKSGVDGTKVMKTGTGNESHRYT